MKDLVQRLEKMAIMVKECLDAELTIVPTAALFETLKAAVVELEVRDNALKAVPSIGQSMRRVGVMEPSSNPLNVHISNNDLADAIHVAQGERYAQKFLDAWVSLQRLSGITKDPTLAIGSDHADSFRAYLLNMMKHQPHFIDRGPRKTTWMGLAIVKSNRQNSWVEVWSSGYRHWVDVENPKVLHRDDRVTVYDTLAERNYVAL